MKKASNETSSEKKPSLKETDSKKNEVCSSKENAFYVVGIGASAGGLEAFSQLLGHLKVDTGMAFVLVQHLNPKHESLLTEILTRTTSMPVTEVCDGIVIEPNHVYVIPPNVRMSISTNQLWLKPRKSDDDHFSIDDFFRSLGQACREHSIGVVLSGTGSDGAEGLAAIAAELAALARSHRTFDDGSLKIKPSLGGDTPNQLEKIFALLRIAKNMDFSHYKRPTIQRRIARRMGINKIDEIEDYATFLRRHPSEIDCLFEDILIKVTCFFRDLESFAVLSQQIFPIFFKETSRSTPIRIWVPGCATGEEAYSIAISIFEFMEKADVVRKVEIFATDISDVALAKARIGEFDDSIAERISGDRLNRFFTKEALGYRVVPEIRDCCIFAK